MATVTITVVTSAATGFPSYRIAGCAALGFPVAVRNTREEAESLKARWER